MSEIKHYRDGDVVLYKRENSKRWQARIKLPTNKWKRISTKKNNLDDASEYACQKYDEFRFKVKSNLPLETRQFSAVANLAKIKMQEELDAGYGKISFKDYIGVIKRYLIPYFGNMNIDKIDYKKLKSFNEWRERKIGRKLKASTINTHNAAMNRVFGVALENGWIHKSQIPVLKNRGLKTERRPFFTKQEYRSLCAFMPAWSKKGRKQITREIRELLRDYVLILTNTGMRHGTETENLKWRNIEEFTGNDKEKYLKFWVNGKTGKRELIARHNVWKYLNRIKDRFDNLKKLDFKELFTVDEYVFRIRRGSRPKDWHGAFEILLRDAKLTYDKHGKKRTLYSLRHTYATFQLLDGTAIHILAKQMGTSINMIEKHYSHLIPSLSASQLAGVNYDEIEK